MITHRISDEPTHGFKRVATVGDIRIAMHPFFGNVVVLCIAVDHFNSQMVKINMIPTQFVELRATTDTMVNQAGEIVNPNSPDALCSEFDFFMSLLNTPVVISDLCTAKIQWADSLQKFDQKVR